VEFFFLIHIICNSVLVGILFVTQLITYPSFLAVDSHVFIGFHKRYTMNISVIVIPFMVGELFSLVYCLKSLQDHVEKKHDEQILS